MYSLLQNHRIALDTAGIFSGPKLFVVLLCVVIMLIVILVGIIIAEVVSKVKKNDDGSVKKQSGDSVDDEWVKDVVQEITTYEGRKASESLKCDSHAPAVKNDMPEKNEPAVRTNRHAVISLRHVIVEFDRDGSEGGIVKKIIDKITIKDQSGSKFVALDDVSFDVCRGEIVGIVGTDGSGKRTLLKLINGEFDPSDGNITVNTGDVHFLSFAGGIDEEITGKKYLYKCAEEAGYTKAFIDKNYSRIVEFAELGGFMEDKVRDYSAGMISRLKFAMAAADDNPGVLIIDELLSVCDVFFRKKCESRIRQIAQNGSAVLIVSNVMNFVVRNCTKAVWIEKGMLRMNGDPEKVCSAYIHMQYPEK